MATSVPKERLAAKLSSSKLGNERNLFSMQTKNNDPAASAVTKQLYIELKWRYH